MPYYLRPIPVSDPAKLPGSWPLAGGPVRFTHVEVLSRGGAPQIVPATDLAEADLDRLTRLRAPLAGIALDRPRLMGILNVTPDSFSDGGTYDGVAEAVMRTHEMVAEGADLIDIGGESTRPGAAVVTPKEEIARVSPVVAALAADRFASPISLDTRNAATARQVPTAIINDVSGLRHDPDIAAVAADRGAALILMHSIGTPETMQALAPTAYDDVVLDVYNGLARSVSQAEAAGVPRSHIMVDPGIGFGKTEAQNLALLSRISLFHSLGCGILLGVSRKGFVGRIADVSDATKRGPGSAAVGLWAVSQGIQMLRVHDIGLHRQMIRLWRASAGLVS